LKALMSTIPSAFALE